MNKDLDFGFERIRAHVDARFARVDMRFAELKGEIKALDSKFNVPGVGLATALAFLGVMVSLDRFL